MIDAVLGYHMNPRTCGVAKFNAQLGERLGIPVDEIWNAGEYDHPLVSIKVSEMGDPAALWWQCREMRTYSLFLHEYAATSAEIPMITKAATVYAGNAEILARVTRWSAGAVEAWCPSLLEATTVPLWLQVQAAPRLSVFVCGMAHKMCQEPHRRLRTLLEAAGGPYAVYVSTAVHEGDRRTTYEIAELREIYGERVVFLGTLSDVAVLEMMRRTMYTACFFDTGARANNTSIWAALEAGAAVITNLDTYSPGVLEHGRTVLDVFNPSLDGVAIGTGLHCSLVGVVPTWEGLCALLRRTDTPATATQDRTVAGASGG